ncbi:MAG: sulfotransferase [Actinomycetota bacterium]|nr:sulfotransferase [Actinomycetota bacterium]
MATPTEPSTVTGRTDIGTIEDLHAAATRMTGLTDFGEGSEYLEGLGVLLESYARDERLTALGYKAHRAALRGALAARALSEAAFVSNPRYREVRIERPIFVTGLPRTGTTALHRLLCEDPRHQGLQMWLTQVPQPRPPRESWAANPIYAHMQENFERHYIENPEFMGVHFMSADMVEECWQILRQSMLSIAYETLAYLPTYSAWLRQQDWTPAYARHKRNLQLIGLNDAGKRWVLKNPSHLFALDALFATYPDALVVQTHRDPRTIVASSSSLSAQACAGQSEKFVGEVIGRTQLELWARGAELFQDARARYEPAQFIDVDYQDFVKDPLGTVELIYAHFGIDLPGVSQRAIAAVHAQSHTGDRRPSHQYSLADFGLTGEEVDERFAKYLAAHGESHHRPVS